MYTSNVNLIVHPPFKKFGSPRLNTLISWLCCESQHRSRKFYVIDNLSLNDSSNNLLKNNGWPQSEMELLIQKIEELNPQLKSLNEVYKNAESAFECRDFKKANRMCRNGIELSRQFEERNEIPRFLKLMNRCNGLSEEFL